MTIVITGAGPIGSTLARHYADEDIGVRVLTRSGSGPEHPLIERRRVDVNDRVALAEAAGQASVIHHCIHASAYDAEAWEAELPGAERTMLDVAAETGATVVFPESLYAFDLNRQPVRETTPIVATTGKPGVRARLLAARAASPVPTISVAASDYFGPGAGANAHLGDRMVQPAITGRTVRPLGSVDQPHSWTYLPDLAAAMIAAARLDSASNRVLFAPTPEPRTQREMANAFAQAAGRSSATVRPVPSWLLRTLGRVHRGTAGLVEMLHLFEHPQVMDSTATEQLLGLSPTPWEDAVRSTVEAALGSPQVTGTRG